MKIEYVWHDEPDRVKIFDTERAFRNNRRFGSKDQEWLDSRTLINLEEKKKRGLVLSYRVIGENNDEKQQSQEAVQD